MADAISLEKSFPEAFAQISQIPAATWRFITRTRKSTTFLYAVEPGKRRSSFVWDAPIWRPTGLCNSPR